MIRNQLLVALIILPILLYIPYKLENIETVEQIEKNLRNECLEYKHTEDDQVICIKRLSEEQINQILNR